MSNKSTKSFVMFSRAGCLLPFLIVFNLFFGWLFFHPLHWLLIEAILILFFVVNSYILTRKIISVAKKSDNVIDVEGEVVDEKRRLKTD